MKSSSIKFGLLAAGLMLAAPAFAAPTITGSLTGGSAKADGGKFNVIDAPAAVGNDNFNNDNVRLFAEKQNYVLTNSLNVDTGPNIAAGTVVNSFYVNFDPLNTESVTGNITFNTDILGIIFNRRPLNQSDYLGSSTTTYENPDLRGFESSDSVSFAGRTLNFSLMASSPGDSFRVITAAVPEPASWAMMILGVGLVGGALRRRQAPKTTVRFA